MKSKAFLTKLRTNLDYRRSSILLFVNHHLEFIIIGTKWECMYARQGMCVLVVCAECGSVGYKPVAGLHIKLFIFRVYNYIHTIRVC